MPRTIHLAVLTNGARPAHHAIFIPTGDSGKSGKLIHVTGNAVGGFFLQFKRNYNFEETYCNYEIIALAEVKDQCVRDTEGPYAEDTTAHDRLESVATTVPPPGRSLNPFDPWAPNCQTWIQDYVRKLVAEGYITESAISIVQNAPKVLPSTRPST